MLFPEIFVGLIPGALGTQNLPRITGLKVALEVIVDRKVLTAVEALEVGVLDEVSLLRLYRVATGQGKVREIRGQGKVREF